MSSSPISYPPLRIKSGSPLEKVTVMIADGDLEIAQVVRSMLSHMGFKRVFISRSGSDSFALIRREHIDLVITDWQMEHINGIELIKRLRTAPESPNRLMPVIMLTARAERKDVEVARDAGVSEYVLKPFTARTVFQRIAQIVENPRQFVLSAAYTGPDRRRKGLPPPGVEERRGARKPALVGKDYITPGLTLETPKLVLPDYAIKQKMGTTQDIRRIVTEDVLKESQAAINEAQTNFLEWIKLDVARLSAVYHQLQMTDTPADALERIKTSALSIKSRAGTFGYDRACEVAVKLYRFCQDHYSHSNNNHLLIVEKHIQVLTVILANDIKGDGGSAGAELLEDMEKLVKKCL